MNNTINNFMTPISHQGPPQQAELSPGAQRLEQFRADHCSNVSQNEMKDYIEGGEQLVKNLTRVMANDNDFNEFLKTNANPKAAAQLMWFLTNKLAKKDQLFTNGALRLDPKPDLDSAKLEKFLIACGNKNNPSYGRISTHMKETLKQGDSQWGLDLRSDDAKLPAGKQTILFAKQPDGTLYLKMEEHGCPPFWEKGFGSLANFREFVGHTFDFIHSRIEKLKGATTGLGVNGLAKRKEHVPEKIKTEFKATMKALFPAGKKSFFQKLFFQKTENEKIRESLYKEGKAFGVSKMENILDSHSSIPQETGKLTDDEILLRQNQAAKMYNLLNEQITKVKGSSSYTGSIKGNEAVLSLSD
jgi:hypothetical protein